MAQHGTRWVRGSCEHEGGWLVGPIKPRQRQLGAARGHLTCTIHLVELEQTDASNRAQTDASKFKLMLQTEVAEHPCSTRTNSSMNSTSSRSSRRHQQRAHWWFEGFEWWAEPQPKWLVVIKPMCQTRGSAARALSTGSVHWFTGSMRERVHQLPLGHLGHTAEHCVQCCAVFCCSAA